MPQPGRPDCNGSEQSQHKQSNEPHYDVFQYTLGYGVHGQGSKGRFPMIADKGNMCRVTGSFLAQLEVASATCSAPVVCKVGQDGLDN